MPLQPVRTPAPAPWRQSLALVAKHLPFTRRTVLPGERMQVAQDALTCLQIVNAGIVKTVHLSVQGHAQIIGVHFKGDWIGLDGISESRYTCDAYALDTSEVWQVEYAALLVTMPQVPELARLLYRALGGELERYRNWRMAMSTLCANARVADFLRVWTTSLSDRDLRTDPIALPLTRAEIGSYLGLTLETVSRSLSHLARTGLIRFDHQGRKTLVIPSVPGLTAYVNQRTEAHPLHKLP